MRPVRRWTKRLLAHVVPASSPGEGVRLPPVRQPAFWAVQVLALTIALAHTLVEPAGTGVFPQAWYLVPSSLFFVPVVYAALKFGVQGAVPTAIWSVVLTVPNLVLFHDGPDRVGILWQSAIMIAIGAFVGLAVDHERAAREEAQAREAARLASERRYRALYDHAANAVFVIDEDGRVEEANAAAMRLFDRDPGAVRGRLLSDVVGAELAGDVLSEPAGDRSRALPRSGSARPVWVQAVGAAPLTGVSEGGGSQVMFRDVTLEHEREQGLEGYARHAIAAREEERRRMARELHDGPLQSLVLLSRQLDAIEDGDDDASALEDAQAIIDETAAELRRLSRTLRPPILDDLGIVAALRSETSSFGRRSGMEARFEAVGEVRPLPEDTELLLLRVAQESLHNAERHSAATAVDVFLAYDPDGTSLVVADDGRGIGTIPSATTLLARGNLGLLGIQERVRLAHGTLDITARPGGGTQVSVTVPSSPP